MPSQKFIFSILVVILLFAACTRQTEPTPAEPTTTPTVNTEPTSNNPEIGTPAPKPSRTPLPTYTPRPSRTPKPSPTVPSGEDFTCLPAGGTRVSAVVAGVTDGDTITVQVGLQNFTVRYIGIDTPETNVQPPERMGPEATALNRDLVSGKRVTLISDPEVGDTDRYGRLLRFVIFEDVFINAELVRAGVARYYPSPNACGELFFSSENEARSNKIGLWAP